jgi:hypothetical protein
MPDEFEPGHMVILLNAPPALLRGLPAEDQAAIRSVVGRPVALAGYSYGQAELEFTDADGDGHTIWVDPSLLSDAMPKPATA